MIRKFAAIVFVATASVMTAGAAYASCSGYGW